MCSPRYTVRYLSFHPGIITQQVDQPRAVRYFWIHAAVLVVVNAVLWQPLCTHMYMLWYVVSGAKPNTRGFVRDICLGSYRKGKLLKRLSLVQRH